MSNSVTIEDSKGETFAEVIDVIGVSEVKKAFQQSVKEGSLHKWFKGSKSKDGKPGWVNVVTGGTCASDKPGEGTPKCVSSSKRASMTKAERLSAARRKKKADPGQQAKTGAAKPTYVSTDKPKKKMSEEMKRDEYGDPIGGPKISKKQLKKNLTSNTPDEQHTTTTSEGYIDLPLEVEIPNTDATFRLGLMFRESLEENKGMLFIFEGVGQHSFHMKNTRIPLDIAFVKEDGTIESIKELTPYSSLPVYSDGEVLFAIEANRGWFTENNVEVGDEIVLGEAKDKKGKGSGTKDACYHKVKSRYSVWPSAYASGALVKCRKVGAANWGNSTKKEGYEIGEGKEEGGYISNAAKAEVRNLRRFGKKGSATPTGYFGQGTSEKAKLAVKRGEEHRARRGVKTKGVMEDVLDEKKGQKCWPGYEKKGTKMMFGKRYNNCVKKEEFSDWRDELGYEGKDDSKKLQEDDMKGMSVKSGHKRPTKSGAGMTQKGVEAYRRRNPGSKLKTAVTTKPSKLKKGSKAANRRKSYCARSAGQMKKFPKAAKDPNSRLRQARRRWNC